MCLSRRAGQKSSPALTCGCHSFYLAAWASSASSQAGDPCSQRVARANIHQKNNICHPACTPQLGWKGGLMVATFFFPTALISRVRRLHALSHCCSRFPSLPSGSSFSEVPSMRGCVPACAALFHSIAEAIVYQIRLHRLYSNCKTLCCYATACRTSAFIQFQIVVVPRLRRSVFRSGRFRRRRKGQY